MSRDRGGLGSRSRVVARVIAGVAARRWALLVVAGAGGLAPASWLGLPGGLARATVFDVSTATQLRNALTAINAAGIEDQHEVRVRPGTYNLSNSLVLDRGRTTIIGVGNAGATLPPNPADHIINQTGTQSRVIRIGPADSTYDGPSTEAYLENLTLRNGQARSSGEGHGGGVYAGKNAWVFLHHCIVENNRSEGRGGGIAAQGAARLEISDSLIRNNSNEYAAGSLTPTTPCGGGGISFFGGGELHMFRTTVSGNTGCRGGGLFISSETGAFSATTGLAIYTNTISGNRAAGRGGGILLQAQPDFQVGQLFSDNTITSNTSGIVSSTGSEPRFGGGVAFSSYGARLSFFGNILAGNTASNVTGAPGGEPSFDCAFTGTASADNTYGQNLVGRRGSCTFFAGSNLVGTSSTVAHGLSSLASNGFAYNMTMQTHMPQASSLALQARSGDACTGTDQRGFAIPNPTTCEIGAVERDGTCACFPDADGDTYGDKWATGTACPCPVGKVMNNQDCHDANSAVHPSLSTFFTSAYTPDPRDTSPDGWDWDCDDARTRQYNGSVSGPNCNAPSCAACFGGSQPYPIPSTCGTAVYGRTCVNLCSLPPQACQSTQVFLLSQACR